MQKRMQTKTVTDAQCSPHQVSKSLKSGITSTNSSNWSFASLSCYSVSSNQTAKTGLNQERGPDELKGTSKEDVMQVEITDISPAEIPTSLHTISTSPVKKSESEPEAIEKEEKSLIDCPSSPQIYRMAADRAHLSRLGFAYRFGSGPFAQNFSKSFLFFEEAASIGASDALAAVAVAQIFGIGVEVSKDAAHKLLRHGILQGSIDALEIRALCWMDGTFGGKRNYASCLELLGMGIARNSAACILWTGFCFEVGLGTTPDPHIARQAYLIAASSKSMMCLVQKCFPGALSAKDPWMLLKMSLFMLHCKGQDIPHSRAMECLKKAALLGLSDAKVYLAICLIQGKWLQKNTSAALYWLRHATKQEDPHPIAVRIIQQLE